MNVSITTSAAPHDVEAREQRRAATPFIPFAVYLMEGVMVGVLIAAAGFYAIVLKHPASPAARMVPDPLHQRGMLGIAIGATALAVVYSPWGRSSGPLLNPAVVLCFVRMGRLGFWQAIVFGVMQFTGAVAGALLVHGVAERWVSDPSVDHVLARPGPLGAGAAWIGEFSIAFVLLGVVLMVNKRPTLAPFAGVFAAALTAFFVTVEAPLSGATLSPARSFGPAVVAGIWRGMRIYFTAPTLGMLLAVQLQRRWTDRPERLCGKLAHPAKDGCVFRCNCRSGGGIHSNA